MCVVLHCHFGPPLYLRLSGTSNFMISNKRKRGGGMRFVKTEDRFTMNICIRFLLVDFVDQILWCLFRHVNFFAFSDSQPEKPVKLRRNIFPVSTWVESVVATKKLFPRYNMDLASPAFDI